MFFLLKCNVSMKTYKRVLLTVDYLKSNCTVDHKCAYFIVKHLCRYFNISVLFGRKTGRKASWYFPATLSYGIPLWPHPNYGVKSYKCHSRYPAEKLFLPTKLLKKNKTLPTRVDASVLGFSSMVSNQNKMAACSQTFSHST